MNAANTPDPAPAAEPTSSPRASDPFAHVIALSAAMRCAVERARQLARIGAPVLVYGEAGVGKELFARAIHHESMAPDAPFVAVHCGRTPPERLACELFGDAHGSGDDAQDTGGGKVDAARGGTLFLGELPELPLELQPRLLRVLEEDAAIDPQAGNGRRARPRVIAASDRNMQTALATGRFRLDLFYRISITSLFVPPLRVRRADLPGLIEHFTAAGSARAGVAAKRITPEVLATFQQHTWRGNVRELREAVESVVLHSGGL